MFKELMQYYLNEFTKRGEPAIIDICSCKVPSDVVLIEYKKIPPIETLGEKEKKDLWLYANELFPGQTKEKLINVSKIVYTIGTLL